MDTNLECTILRPKSEASLPATADGSHVTPAAGTANYCAKVDVLALPEMSTQRHINRHAAIPLRRSARLCHWATLGAFQSSLQVAPSIQLKAGG